MLGQVVFVGDNQVKIKLKNNVNIATNLMNLHVILEEGQKRVLGEITSIDGSEISIGLLGEFLENSFYSGVIKKPGLNAKVRFITKEELELVIGNRTENSFLLGDSPLYNHYPIYADINKLFSNHFAIFGNTGSGKSCGVARVLQNVFLNKIIVPVHASFLIFDSYGEYHNAFKNIHEIDPNFQFKYYTTNDLDTEGEQLRVPIWTFSKEDLAVLLFANEHSQLTIIEEMIRLANLFSTTSEEAKKYKNHLIAKAIINVLYNNQSSSSKRNDVFRILNVCSTEELKLDVVIHGLGYSRTLRELFTIDSGGNFPERNLLIDYVNGFIEEEIKHIVVPQQKYSLTDLERALDFVMISEGIVSNPKLYQNASAIKVRLHSIIVGKYAKFFDYPEYISKEEYIQSLITKDGRKAQIINFNFEDVDDWFSKSVTKYYCNIIFEYCKSMGNKSNLPFNLILEEAHRYVQKDNDIYLFGYNIFERIAKEGRKYGVIMGLLSQRPVELSGTVVSQISNFLIFKMTHPLDVDYIKKMLPNINEEIIEKQKILQSGTCVAFGKAFTIPMLVHFTMPNPAPYSSNIDIVSSWKAS